MRNLDRSGEYTVCLSESTAVAAAVFDPVVADIDIPSAESLIVLQIHVTCSFPYGRYLPNGGMSFYIVEILQLAKSSYSDPQGSGHDEGHHSCFFGQSIPVEAFQAKSGSHEQCS